MASYPTAVKTFTTKQDGPGNTIQAANINDLQGEVTAIEAGLLNGTAPLNSSNSTVGALAVTGLFNAKGALQLNSTAGSSGMVPMSQGGSSSPSWSFLVPTVLAKSTNYSLLETDGYGGHHVTVEFTGSGLSTVDLYAVASTSAGKVVRIKNMSATSTSILTVNGSSTQLIDSTLTFVLNVEDAVTLQVNNDGTRWLIV